MGRSTREAPAGTAPRLRPRSPPEPSPCTSLRRSIWSASVRTYEPVSRRVRTSSSSILGDVDPGRRGAPRLISTLPGDERTRDDRTRRASTDARRVPAPARERRLERGGRGRGRNRPLELAVRGRARTRRRRGRLRSRRRGRRDLLLPAGRDRPARAPGAGLGHAHHGGRDALRGSGGSARLVHRPDGREGRRGVLPAVRVRATHGRPPGDVPDPGSGTVGSMGACGEPSFCSACSRSRPR